jgi:hypothetical protein
MRGHPTGLSIGSSMAETLLTSWLSLFAAPSPVGPAPITRTSTLLRGSDIVRMEGHSVACTYQALYRLLDWTRRQELGANESVN